MQIDNGFIVQQVLDTEKQTVVACQEQSVTIPLSQIVVWWKRAWHRVASNEIGDGMQPVCVLERPFILPHVDTTWLTRGLSLYQEFDEHTGAHTTYLYGFPKQQAVLDHIQSIVTATIPAYKLEQVGRFTTLAGPAVSYPQDFVTELTHSGYTGAISFLFGLCLGYGSEAIVEDKESLHITIPLVGTIPSHVVLIETVLQDLASHGMFVHMSTHNQSFGQTMQLRITDWELITIFTAWLGGDIHESPRKKTYDTMKSSLLEWLGKQTVDNGFLDVVEYSVSKVLKK